MPLITSSFLTACHNAADGKLEGSILESLIISDYTICILIWVVHSGRQAGVIIVYMNNEAQLHASCLQYSMPLTFDGCNTQTHSQDAEYK